MFVAERFLSKVIKEYEKHPVSKDNGTWHPFQTRRFLKLMHHIHSPLEKSIVERSTKYIGYRTPRF